MLGNHCRSSNPGGSELVVFTINIQVDDENQPVAQCQFKSYDKLIIKLLENTLQMLKGKITVTGLLKMKYILTEVGSKGYVMMLRMQK